MKRSHTLAFLALVVGVLPAFAQVDPLATVPGFTPAFSLTESIKDSIKTTVETFPAEPGFPPEPPLITRTVETADTSTISITANITGIDLASIGPDTPFEVAVGALTVTGTLGDDLTYTDLNKATKRSIFIPGRHHPETGAVVGASGVKLTWTATRLTISVIRSNLDDADPGSAAAATKILTPVSFPMTSPIKDIIPVTVKFAGFQSAPRHGFIQGTTSVRKQTFGSEALGTLEEIPLNTVSITGAFDTTVPTVTITAPANNSSPGGSFTITGKASDGHGIQTIEYATDPATTAPWTPITNITDLPPALGAALWGTTNKQWTFSLTGQPFGTNKFWVRTVDTSGNRSTYATIALVNPMPALLTGRWDGLVTPTPTGRQGYLTFTCDVKGALSGKLTLEGTAAALPVVGTWSGGSINGKVMNGTKTEFLLTGMVNSTAPANTAAALLSFNLAKPAVVVTDPPVPSGNGTAFRCPFSATNKLPKLPTPAPALGRFNLSIAPGNGTTSPSGCGYFSMVVTDTGAVTIAGKTADGSTLTMSPVLGAGGQVPVFVPLYDNKGSFSVLEVIDMTLGTITDATANWNRPVSFKDKQFPTGFSVTPMTHGERYVAPAANVRVLGLIAASPNASAEWIGDAVPVMQTQAVEVSKTNTVAAVGGSVAFKATITSATGVVAGSFTLPGSKVATPWSALIVGNQADGHYIALPVAPSVLNRFGKMSFSGDVPTPAGSDDFNDNSKDLSKWRGTDISYGGAVLTEINGRLEFTVKNAVAETQVLRPWTRNFGSLYEEFEAIIDVHNAITPPALLPGPVTQPNASIGISLYNSADAKDYIYLELYRGSDGYYFLTSLIVDDNEDLPNDADAEHLAADGSLRLHYDPATRVVTASYDANGATDGYAWTQLASYGIGGTGGTTANAAWSLTGDPVLGVTVSTFDEKMVVTSGQVHADNFQFNSINP